MNRKLISKAISDIDDYFIAETQSALVVKPIMPRKGLPTWVNMRIRETV